MITPFISKIGNLKSFLLIFLLVLFLFINFINLVKKKNWLSLIVLPFVFFIDLCSYCFFCCFSLPSSLKFFVLTHFLKFILNPSDFLSILFLCFEMAHVGLKIYIINFSYCLPTINILMFLAQRTLHYIYVSHILFAIVVIL